MIEFPSFARLDWAARLFAAHLVTAFLLLLNVVSFSLPYAGDIRPFFILMAVYYWAIYRPTFLPPVITFLMGLAIDIITGLPPGMTALVLLAAQWIVRDQRLFLMGQPYLMVWLGFFLTSLGAGVCQWIIFCIFTHSIQPLMPLGASIILSAVFFPIVTLLLIVAHKLLPVASKSYRVS